LVGLTNTKRKDIRRRLYLVLEKTLFIYFRVVPTYKQKKRGVNYHHYYSPTPSGGTWATEGRICDTSESEARRT
jgi:hypothetical protein